MTIFNFSSFAILIAIAVLPGCTKNNSNPEKPPVNTPKPDSSSTPAEGPHGIIYLSGGLDFIKVDASSNAIYWRTNNLNGFGSYNCPIIVDSNYFYAGNVSGLNRYSTINGLSMWTISWLAFSDAIGYREAAFNDSLVFLTSPTSVWDHGYLFCLNKSSGTILWKKQIDSGSVDINFNGIPVVKDDKVITLTRGQNNQAFITAFSIKNGEQQWAVPVSGDISSKLWLMNGKIFSAYGTNAYCYDAGSGKLIWKTDMQVPVSKGSYHFFDGNKLIVVKVINNSQYKIIQIQQDAGTILQSGSLKIPSSYDNIDYQIIAPAGCLYSNNNLYFSRNYSNDSLELFAFELTSLSQQWKTGYAHVNTASLQPVITDKFILLPVYDPKNVSGKNDSRLLFMNLSGKEVKEITVNTSFWGGFAYVENGIVYRQQIVFAK